MLNRAYRFLIEDIGMVNILLVCLLIITIIRKNIFISYQYIYIWLFLTALCNTIIVINLYYEKWENNNSFPFISCSLCIGEHYKGETLSSSSNIIKNKKNNKLYNFSKKTKLSIAFLKLFVCTYVENFFYFYFLPLLSTLLFLKYGIFRYGKFLNHIEGKQNKFICGYLVIYLFLFFFTFVEIVIRARQRDPDRLLRL